MKRIIIFILVLAVYSCYDDKGNYDYIHVREIKIDSIKSSYEKIAYSDYLKIEPILVSENKNDILDYLWLLYTPNTNKDVSDYTIDTLSREKSLNYLVALKPGNYKIRYMVKNKSNSDLTYFAETKLSVVTKFSEGFYILKEINGGDTDMDMINSDDKRFLNLITASTGKPMSGKPISFSLYPEYSYLNTLTGENDVSNFLLPVTDSKDVGMFRIEDMVRLREHKDLFFDKAPEEEPYFFYPGKFYFGYVSSKGHYNNYQVPAWGMRSSGYFGNIDLLGEDELGYKLFPEAVLFDYNSLFFDVKNGRFIAMDYNASFHLLKDGNSVPKPNGIKHKILFMGGGRVGGKDYAYSIFKDKDSDKRLLYFLSKLDLTRYTNPIGGIKEFTMNSKINNAKIFTTNRLTAKMLYYVANNKLYAYDYDSDLEQELVFEEFPLNEEITYINNIFWGDGSGEHFDYFVIATYIDGKYNIYMYDMVGGLPYGKYKRKLSGDGKVYKIQYVHPNIKNANRNSYSLYF